MNENDIKANAVSLYGQDGLDDFPVLKAFQQYVDAEQNKARKRMIMLCIFFGVLMTVMITVFLLVLKDVTGKNQELNDRFVEYVMKNNERQNVIVQPTAQSNDSAIKAMTDTLMAMQRQMAEQQEKAIAAQTEAQKAAAQAEVRKAAAEAAAKAAAAATAAPSMEELARQRQIDADTQKLIKARALLKAEKEKLAAEKERLHKQEVEMQRRKMYPEYYEKLDRANKPQEAAPITPEAARPKAPPKNDAPISYFDAYNKEVEAEESAEAEPDDIDDLISGLPPTEPIAEKSAPKPPSAKVPSEKPTPKKAASAMPAPKAPAAMPDAVKPDTEKPAAKPKAPAADHFNVPLEINGEASDWLIPTT